MKFKKKFLMLNLIYALILNILPIHQTYAIKTTTIKRNIGNLSKQLNQNKNNQREHEKTKQKLKKQAEKIDNEIELIQKQLEKAEQEVANKQKIINSYNEQIKNKEQKIDNYQTEINQANKSIEQSKETVRNYLSKMYKLFKNKQNILQLMIEAKNFSDAGKTSKYINEYSKLEKDVCNSYLNQINKINNLKRSTENEKNDLNQTKVAMDKEVEAIKIKEAEIDSKRENQQANLKIINKNIKDVDIKKEVLQKIENKLNKEREKLENTFSSSSIDSYYKNDFKLESDQNNSPVLNNTNPAQKSQFIYPLDYSVGYVSSGFGGARNHKGCDVPVPLGTPVKASFDGNVNFAGATTYGHGFGGYGNAVLIDHGNGWQTLYAHMDRINTNINKGKKVKQGDIVGYAGNTVGPNHKTSGIVHLHFELRHNGKAVDPENYIHFPRSNKRSKNVKSINQNTKSIKNSSKTNNKRNNNSNIKNNKNNNTTKTKNKRN